MKYLVANWKSNKTWREAEAWVKSLSGYRQKDDLEVVVCPPSIYVMKVKDWLDKYGVEMKLGVQDVSPFPFGTYTGALAAEMLAGIATYAIVGHSERRRYFHETNQEIANKVERCVENEILPIVCVDEPYDRAQIAAIEDKYLDKCLFAYEPLEHISDGVHLNPDDPEHAERTAGKIEEMLQHRAKVIYGGSASASSIKNFIDQPSIHGALVGGASLKAEEWVAMVGRIQ